MYRLFAIFNREKNININIKRCSEGEKQCELNTNMYFEMRGGGGSPQLRKERERK